MYSIKSVCSLTGGGRGGGPSKPKTSFRKMARGEGGSFPIPRARCVTATVDHGLGISPPLSSGHEKGDPPPSVSWDRELLIPSPPPSGLKNRDPLPRQEG